MMGRDFLSKCETPVYSRVILPLQALLEGEFFNQYIKRGQCLILFTVLLTTVANYYARQSFDAL